jgi:nitrogen fixation protein FixH
MRFLRLNDDNPLTGWHMLAIVFAFFGTIIAVNFVMAFAAMGTFPGLVVENSYVASQHYDELLAKARLQDEAGWRFDLTAEDGVIRVSLAQEGATPLRGLSVLARVGRPSTTQEDRIFDLVPAGDGAYAASEPLPPGVWEVDLEAGLGSEVLFRRTQEIFVKRVEPRP